MTRKARRGSNERCGEREKIGHPYFVLFCFVIAALSPYLFLSIYLTFFFKANPQKGRETGQNPHGRIILCLSRCSSRPSMLGAVRNEGAWHRIQTARRRRRFELVSFDFDFDADRYANVRLYIFLALICLSVGLVWRAEIPDVDRRANFV